MLRTVEVPSSGGRFAWVMLGDTVRGNMAFAPAGASFDEFDPIHQEADSLRHAQWIQAARDAGDYAEADRIRGMVTGWDAVVSSTKGGTFVLDAAVIREFASHLREEFDVH